MSTAKIPYNGLLLLSPRLALCGADSIHTTPVQTASVGSILQVDIGIDIVNEDPELDAGDTVPLAGSVGSATVGTGPLGLDRWHWTSALNRWIAGIGSQVPTLDDWHWTVGTEPLALEFW